MNSLPFIFSRTFAILASIHQFLYAQLVRYYSYTTTLQFILFSIYNIDSMENIKYFSNVKSQDVKFNAFFHYLKSFSQTAVDTLYKLQSEFNRQMFKDKKDSQKLCTIKNLLQAYQIFTLEVKDSCDFVQISQFGFCIGKTFMQLMKIVKWVLKEWIKDTSSLDKMAKVLQKADGMDDGTEMGNVCSFCEQIIKTSPGGRQMKNKRKGIAGGVGNQFRQAKRIHINQASHLIDRKNQVIEGMTMKQIQSKKYIFDNEELQILNRKQQTLKLQISNGENVLQEILNEFNAKNESIARFVINSQASFMEDVKANQDADFSYFQEKMKELIRQKFQEASEKIKNLTKLRLEEYENEKKKRQVCRQVQTTPIQISDLDKFEYKWRKLNSELQKMKNELNAQKEMTESLKQLLQSKSIEFQSEFLSYRKDLIMENNDKIYLKSLKSFKDILSKNGDQKDQQNRENIVQNNFSNIISNRSNTKISNLVNRDKRDPNRKHLKNQIKLTFEDAANQQNEDHFAHTQGANFIGSAPSDKKIHSFTGNGSDPWISKYSKLDLGADDEIDSESSLKGLANNVSTQTDSFNFPFQGSTDENVRRELRKTISPKKDEPKDHKKFINIYSNVKSRVYNTAPKPKTHILKQIAKDILQNKQPENIFIKRPIQDHPETEPQPQIECFKVKDEPVFLPVKRIMISRKDILSLFINELNAKNYECLLYRNQMFNITNLNQKRMVNHNNKSEARPLNSGLSTPKKDMFLNENLQAKIVKSFYYQINYIKKREKLLYELLKCILRSPYEIMKKLQYTQLQGNNENCHQDALQYSELKRMINLLMKFHQGCIRHKKDVICVHLAVFCEKIGIRLYE